MDDKQQRQANYSSMRFLLRASSPRCIVGLRLQLNLYFGQVQFAVLELDYIKVLIVSRIPTFAPLGRKIHRQTEPEMLLIVREVLVKDSRGALEYYVLLSIYL